VRVGKGVWQEKERKGCEKGLNMRK